MRITDIKKFAIHDGPGIRTTVFFKGCPLRCLWCHNPETIGFQSELGYYSHKCINCGMCVKICPTRAHALINGKHVFNRSKCIACGKCEKVCLGEALTLYGKEMTVDELMPILMEDKEFYNHSGGGVTLSGGEPLLHADFCRELLRALKAEGIHTAVDTCGFAPKAEIDKIIDDTDIFLYDIKSLYDDKHIKYTGQSNKIILDNLKYILERNKTVEIRIPLIPTLNDDQIEPIGRFLNSLGFSGKAKVLPYHNYSVSKYKALGKENTLPDVHIPDDGQLADAVSILRSYGLNAVSGRE